MSISTEKEPDLCFIHNDHLGTPQVVTNQSQQVVWMVDYLPFGQVIADPNNTLELYSRFPGQYFDAETNLYYNYFRDYDPTIGRYIQADPIGLAGGINTYMYVDGNPLLTVDPLGLAACYVLFPDFPITYSPGRTSINLGGHAGVIGYNSSGSTRYYEFGRYEPGTSGIVGTQLSAHHGNVRRIRIPDLVLDKDENPTQDSLRNLARALSRDAGRNTRVQLRCYKNADELKIYEYISNFANNSDRAAYSWNPFSPNHCSKRSF